MLSVTYKIPVIIIRLMRRKEAKRELTKDIVIIFLGACASIALAYFGVIDKTVGYLGNNLLVSFLAGMFWTSAFTIAPSSVVFANIITTDPVSVALWGGLGAMCGDLILFFFIRDRFMKDIDSYLRPSVMKHFIRSFHLGFLKWLSPVVGALVLASPLPDELGIALMGLSRLRLMILMPVSFVMNTLGIYGIYLLAR